MSSKRRGRKPLRLTQINGRIFTEDYELLRQLEEEQRLPWWVILRAALHEGLRPHRLKPKKVLG